MDPLELINLGWNVKTERDLNDLRSEVSNLRKGQLDGSSMLSRAMQRVRDIELEFSTIKDKDTSNVFVGDNISRNVIPNSTFKITMAESFPGQESFQTVDPLSSLPVGGVVGKRVFGGHSWYQAFTKMRSLNDLSGKYSVGGNFSFSFDFIYPTTGDLGYESDSGRGSILGDHIYFQEGGCLLLNTPNGFYGPGRHLFRVGTGLAISSILGVSENLAEDAGWYYVPKGISELYMPSVGGNPVSIALVFGKYIVIPVPFRVHNYYDTKIINISVSALAFYARFNSYGVAVKFDSRSNKRKLITISEYKRKDH